MIGLDGRRLQAVGGTPNSVGDRDQPQIGKAAHAQFTERQELSEIDIRQQPILTAAIFPGKTPLVGRLFALMQSATK
jgi:hypothetical protein